MGKTQWKYDAPRRQGRCLSCHDEFRGPGERCQRCRQALAARRKRKPR